MIATDRDLLVFEPRLFNEMAAAAHRIFDASNVASFDSAGTTVTVTGGRWNDWGVGAGWVILINDAPAEVITRFSQTQLYVTKLRESPTAAVIAAGSGSGLSARISTFRPQLEAVHEAILRALGIEPTQPAGPGVITEANITNPKALLRAECLGTLAMIYSAAAVASGENNIHWAKASTYADRYAEERRRLTVNIDTNADGKADAVRRISPAWLVRA
ncbi:MAG: hypothetical protein ACKVZJ_14805 [Phycisphaerales bacterium]